MGHDSRGFWYQIHALDLYKRPSPYRSGSRVCWTSWRNRDKAAWHGWKIGWPDLHTRPLILESIYGWSGKPAGIRSGPGSSIPWEDHNWKIIEVEVLGYKQRSRIRSFVDGNGDGLENGWKDSGDVLRFKTGSRLGKKWIGSSGCKNVGIFGSS